MKAFKILSPGRVNLIGEHVDYSDGVVLPAAINRAITIEINPITEQVVRLHALDLNESAAFSLNDLTEKRLINGQKMPGFAKYPAGVAWALKEAGYPLQGFEARYRSTIPIGAGLSSSAAVEVGFALAWKTLRNLDLEPMKLVQVCQKAENQYVGVNSGLMDQFACFFGIEGYALKFDTADFSWQPARLPEKSAIVIADSSVRRTLATSGYNERRQDIELAVSILQKSIPWLKSLRGVSPEQFESLRAELPERAGKRAEHVVYEIARVEQAIPLLAAGDAERFGQLMYASHASLRDLFEVSIPALDTLVEIARKLPGCYGAKLTGAGFGGCTVSLVESSKAGPFIAELSKQYTDQTGLKAQIYCCQASQGTHVIE